MNIHELETFNLADAVRFHDQLNTRLWGKDEHLMPQVRDKLLDIAEDFKQFLGIRDVEIKDITVSGSNAAYTYTPHSDIDLHLIVDIPELNDDVYRELFNAKKYQYNDEHDIRIGGYDVELYVQPSDDKHVSSGIYSVLNNKWIQVPKPRKADVDDISVRSKYEDIGNRVESALKDRNITTMKSLWQKIKDMRTSGLATNGEFGPENLAFKLLRTHGLIEKLKLSINAEHDRELSLKEKAPPSRVVYGFKGVGEDIDTDGVMMTRASNMSSESVGNNNRGSNIHKEIHKFTRYCARELGLKKLPKIDIKDDEAYSKKQKTFGQYVNDTETIHLQIKGRHILDVFRTLAHEMVHFMQDQREPMPSTAGDTGSKYENEAHATAGVIMRHFDRKYPNYFEQRPVDEDAEMDQQNGTAPNPGQPLNYPEGTVDVAVSDVYDWYKLGQKISDIEGASPKDFNTGPPHTLLTFSTEKDEERYIKQLKRLGFGTRDVKTGPEDLDEGRVANIAAAAAMAASLVGCATPQSNGQPMTVGQAADVARAAYGLKNLSRAGAQEEFNQELKNYLRARRGEAGAANQSKIYQMQQGQVKENASGYIPTKKQAKDRRFVMALTKDVQPGEVGRQANKLALDVGKQGEPHLLITGAANQIGEKR